MWVNWVDVKGRKNSRCLTSQTQGTLAPKTHMCAPGHQRGASGWAPTELFWWRREKASFPGQLGCCIVLQERHPGWPPGVVTWKTIPGYCAPWYKPTSPHLNCTGSIFIQGILPTLLILFPLFTHWDGPHEKNCFNNLLNLPYELTLSPPPAAIRFTAVDTSFLRDSLMQFIWLIINLLP